MAGNDSRNNLLIKNVSFIKFDFVPFQHQQVFFTIRFLAMVFLLIPDVLFYSFDHRLTHGEGTVSSLPLETAWLDFERRFTVGHGSRMSRKTSVSFHVDNREWTRMRSRFALENERSRPTDLANSANAL